VVPSNMDYHNCVTNNPVEFSEKLHVPKRLENSTAVLGDVEDISTSLNEKKEAMINLESLSDYLPTEDNVFVSLNTETKDILPTQESDSDPDSKMTDAVEFLSNNLLKENIPGESPNAELEVVPTNKSSSNKSRPQDNHKTPFHDDSLLSDNPLSNESYVIALHRRNTEHIQRASLSPTTANASEENPQNYHENIAALEEQHQDPRKRPSKSSLYQERSYELSKEDSTNLIEKASTNQNEIVSDYQAAVSNNGDVMLHEPSPDSAAKTKKCKRSFLSSISSMENDNKNVSTLSKVLQRNFEAKDSFIPHVEENKTKVETQPLGKRKPRWLKELEDHLSEPQPQPSESDSTEKEALHRMKRVTTPDNYFSTKSGSPCSSLPPRGQEILTQFSATTMDRSCTNTNVALGIHSEEEIIESKLVEKNRIKGQLEQEGSNTTYKNSCLQKKQETESSKVIPTSSSGNLGCNRNMSQTSETGESYVSTLPPDSDYVSEDDPFEFPSGGNYRLKLTPVESKKNIKGT